MKHHIAKTLEALNIAAGVTRGVPSGANGTPGHARAVAGAPPPAAASETIDWDAVVDKINAEAGHSRSANPRAIYGQQSATPGGEPHAANTPSSHTGTVDWDGVVASMNATLPAGAIIPGAARPNGLDVSSISEAGHGQTDTGGASSRVEAIDQG